MTPGAFIDAVQTTMLVVVTLAFIYIIQLLRAEIRRAALNLSEVIANQKELDQNVRRSWERIDAIEGSIGVHNQPLKDIVARLEALEKAKPPPRPSKVVRQRKPKPLIVWTGYGPPRPR